MFDVYGLFKSILNSNIHSLICQNFDTNTSMIIKVGIKRNLEIQRTFHLYNRLLHFEDLTMEKFMTFRTSIAPLIAVKNYQVGMMFDHFLHSNVGQFVVKKEKKSNPVLNV